jgi:hypothetical protein
MAIGAVLGVIGAATSIFGGIKGSQDASAANAANAEYQKKQQELLNKQAELQNKYNKEKFEADKTNYKKMAAYNFDTAVKKWQFDTQVQAIQAKTDAQKALMSAENTQKQLTFNEIAQQQAKSKNQLALDEAFAEDAFARQDLLVNQLQSQGQALLGQAGKSMAKKVQSIDAQVGRDLAVLDASLTGQINQSNLEMFDITLGKYAADAKAMASMMLTPEKMPDIPAPVKPPEPIWVEPMKVLPGMAAQYQPQSTAMPLIQGLGSAATSLAKIDFSSPNKNQGGFTPGGYNTSNLAFNPQAFSIQGQLAG